MKSIKKCLLIGFCIAIHLCQGMDTSAKRITEFVVTNQVMRPLTEENIKNFIGKEILYRKDNTTYKKVMLGAKDGEFYWVFPLEANGFYSGTKGKCSLIGRLYEVCEH